MMAEEKSKSKSLKSKIKHEFQEMLLISAFFGLFFFSFATYKMYLLHRVSLGAIRLCNCAHQYTCPGQSDPSRRLRQPRQTHGT